ncbi:MAG: hypothetical protein ACRC10_12100 [Thermoguttaceae bacterium]
MNPYFDALALGGQFTETGAGVKWDIAREEVIRSRPLHCMSRYTFK